jgi:transposase
MNMTSNNTSNKDFKTEILGRERRRRWSPSEKQSVISETYQPGFTVSQVARKYGIPPSQLFYWRRRLEEGALVAVGSEEKVIPESEVKALVLSGLVRHSWRPNLSQKNVRIAA